MWTRLPAAGEAAVETLLALCARGRGHAEMYARLQAAAGRVHRWEDLAARAEAHGLTPLAATHLRAAGVTLPGETRARLQGGAVQHAHAARVRERVLGEALTALGKAGIEPLVLKGAALAHVVYPQPSLRPMRDVDLLVRAAEARRALEVLAALGFVASGRGGVPTGHHHLEAVERWVDGVWVSVEVHAGVDVGTRWTFEDLAARAVRFEVGGAAAATLGREEMLWHVYWHTFRTHWRYEGARLIGLADVVTLVEAWAGELDWDRLRQEYPAAWRVLPTLGWFTPWGEAVSGWFGPAIRARGDEVGAALAGWPWREGERGWRDMLREAVWPGGVWLRLMYGYGPTRSDRVRAWLAHVGGLGKRVWRRVGSGRGG